MAVHKDIITGDELISDKFNIQEVDPAVFEVDCQMISEERGADVDEINGDDAEEVAADASKSKFNEIVRAYGLQETAFDMRSYREHIRGYFVAIKNKMHENGADSNDINTFLSNSDAYLRAKVLPNFLDYQFFVGPSENGMVVLQRYREDGETPYLTFWKWGLESSDC